MKITIVYVSTNKQFIQDLDVPGASTVQQAIEVSNLLRHHPEINLGKNQVGIFNHIVSLDTELKDNDRIEIYRPLIIDPMQARRLRAIAKC